MSVEQKVSSLRFEDYVKGMRVAMRNVACPACGRRQAAHLTVIPYEGEAHVVKLKPKPEHGCARCRLFPPMRLELREWSPDEGLTAAQLYEAVTKALLTFQEEATHALMSETTN